MFLEMQDFDFALISLLFCPTFDLILSKFNLIYPMGNLFSFVHKLLLGIGMYPQLLRHWSVKH